MAVPLPEDFSPAFTLCIRLPFLRGPLPRQLDAGAGGTPAIPRALRLWPGHRPVPGACPGDESAVPEGWHEPGDYPFSHAEATACLAAFGALDARDLAGARDAADRAHQERRARELGELADLAAFAASEGRGAPREAPDAGRSAAAGADRVVREQAQKLLLWLWLQEGRLADLAGLAAGCARDLRALAGSFGAGDDEEGPAGPVGAGAGAGASLGADIPLHPGLIPPWRIAAMSAALFMAADTAFFVEGPMREELLDLLDFRPAPALGERLGCAAPDAARIVAAEAPLWRALGRSRPEGPATARVWLTWGRP